MQQDLITQLEQEGKPPLTDWVYSHATRVLVASRAGEDAEAAADAALKELPEGYEADAVRPALLEWAQQPAPL